MSNGALIFAPIKALSSFHHLGVFQEIQRPSKHFPGGIRNHLQPVCHQSLSSLLRSAKLHVSQSLPSWRLELEEQMLDHPSSEQEQTVAPLKHSHM